MKNKRKLVTRLVLVAALALVLILAHYLFMYRTAHAAFDLITESNTNWNCINYDAQFYVSEERRIEGNIVIEGETVPLWIGYRPAYAELYACESSVAHQVGSNDYLIAKTRFRAYNGKLHFIFIEDVAGLGVDKLVFEEAD